MPNYLFSLRLITSISSIICSTRSYSLFYLLFNLFYGFRGKGRFKTEKRFLFYFYDVPDDAEEEEEETEGKDQADPDPPGRVRGAVAGVAGGSGVRGGG